MTTQEDALHATDLAVGTQAPRQIILEKQPTFGQQQLLALGVRLRDIRRSRTWSLKRLADESGVSLTAIQKIESGAVNTSLVTVMRLSETLGEPVERLVRASQMDTATPKFVHVAIPKRPKRTVELSFGLKDARLNGNVVVVGAGTSMERAPQPEGGPTFGYVISGNMNAVFADGTTQSLSMGDAMHLSRAEPMIWTNPHKADVQVLCIADPHGAGFVKTAGALL